MNELDAKQLVRKCYLDYLNREPDEPGFNHYVHLMKTNQIDEESLINTFKNSPEYKLSHPVQLDSSTSVDTRMKKEWDERAKMNHKFVISTDHSDSEEDFWNSGVDECNRILDRNGTRFQQIIQNKEPSKMKILEIGCGIGRILIPMSKIFGTAIGIDVSSEMVRLGKQHIANISNCEILENNGIDLAEFPDNSFDFCYSFIVFQHIPDKKVVEKYISEVSRVLKPGCLFRFQVRGKISSKPNEITTWDGVQFTSDEMHQMAQKNNFEIIEEGNDKEEYYWLTFFKKTNTAKIFWVDSTCTDPEHNTKLDYNSHVCAQCYGVLDKNKKNFGDQITKYIYHKITNNDPIYAAIKNFEDPVFFGSGSIMNYCAGWKNVIVWGTGIIHSQDNFEKPNNVLSVRGPFTRKRFLELGYDCPEVYGDPGLLLPNFYNKHIQKKYKIGVIPHYIDYEFCKNNFSAVEDLIVIDVCNPVEKVIDDICQCQYTISSSLHGIIISHAYGIKSCWVKFSDYIYGDDIKFLDYYHSLYLTEVEKPIKFLDAIKSDMPDTGMLINLVDNFPNPEFPINTKQLMETCPF